ncbi:hypothetical protein JAO29_07395 [Edaphobacter sp. HDX4]|uniref:sigma factor n=1 Tax=Edaphobacter sp. HDX4 TaxID=2794064 RepID=UPI002FE4FC41
MNSWIANLIDQRSLFLAFVRRRVKDASTSEDILQIAYSRAISQQQSLKTSGSANAWFFRILRMPSSITIATRRWKPAR